MSFLWSLILVLAWSIPLQAQVFYLTPFTGSGTETDPFYPHGVRPGPAQCTEIARPDPTTIVNRWAVCNAPALPVGTGVVELGSNPRATLSRSQRTAVETAVRGTLTGSTLGEIIGRAADRNGHLRPSRQDGHVRVAIGGTEIFSTVSSPRESLTYPSIHQWFAHFFHWLVFPQNAFAASYSTGFNCANSTLLDCDGLTWTESGGSNWAINTNQARVTSSATDRAKLNSDMATDDHEVSIEIVQISRGTATWTNVGPIARVDPGSPVSFDYCYVENNSGGDVYRYGYQVSGTTTEIGTASTTAGAQTLKIRMSGDQHTCLSNGTAVLGPTTTANVTTLLRPGLRNQSSGAGSGQTQVESWLAEDYVPPGGSGHGLRRRNF